MSDPFVGVDPDDTMDIDFHGAVITIGVMPQGVWERITNELHSAHRDAKRRAIARMVEEKRDPSATVPFAGREVTMADVEVLRDAVYMESVFKLSLEAAGWSVRGHKNWNKTNGSPVPCMHIVKMYEGTEWKRLDGVTLRHYAANAGLVDAVWTATKKMQELEDDAKKSSPQAH